MFDFDFICGSFVRPMGKGRGTLFRGMSAIVAAGFIWTGFPGEASAELASMKIGRADLVSLGDADAYYQSATTHSAGQGFARPVEIKALARALNYDPDLIYSYVKNKIEITPLFGLQKGALGAHLDKHGTAFDQAHLMAELAKEAMAQAGNTITDVKIVYGEISGLNGAEFEAWFGITDAKAACTMLAYGGIPATVNSASSCTSLTGSVTSVTMKHAWVRLTTGAGTFDYDPAYKTHQHFAGIDLADAMSYSRTGFSSAARGSMISDVEPVYGVNFVEDISPSGIGSALLTYSNTLLAALKSATHKDKTLDEIIGGSVILDEDLPTGGANGAPFPYTLAAGIVADDVPDQFRTVLGVWFSGNAFLDTTHDPVDAEFYVDEVYGRKIELVPDDGGGVWRYPQNIPWTLRLMVDEALVKEKDGIKDAIHDPGMSTAPVEGYVSAPNRTGYLVRLDVNHPYAANGGTYMDRLAESQVDVATTVSIVSGWGYTSPELMAKWAREFGQDTNMWPVIPLDIETMEEVYEGSFQENTKAKLGAGWLAQYSRMADMLARVGGGVSLTHHTVGVVYADTLVDEDCNWTVQNSTFGTCRYWIGDQVMRMDLHSGLSAVHLGNSDAGEEAILQGIAAAAATLEGSVFEQQMDNVDTASTAERFQWAEENLSTAKYYHYQDGDQAAIGTLTLQEGYATSDPNKPYYVAGYGVFGGATIAAYLGEGYEVFAVNDEFLGPGFHLGSFYSTFSVYHNRGGIVNEASRQRGAAYVAVKRDAGGKVIDIAHIVTGTEGGYKGGGGAASNDQEDEFDPAKAADILKDEFEDRSVLHGVDLASGGTSWSSGTLISTGSGGFPYELSFEYSFVNNLEQPDNASQRHWDSGAQNNHQSSATISGSGLEGMGASHPWNAVGSIVAFYVAVDMATEDTDLDNIILLPFIDHWWREQLSYNVVSLSGLGGGSQFVRLPDLSFNGPAGSGATLVQTGARYAVRDGEGGLTPALYQRWVYDQIDFTATLKDKSQLFFDALSYKVDDKLRAIDSYRHMLMSYTAPSGFAVNYSYDAGTRDRGIRLTSVTNDFGRTLLFGYPSSTSASLASVTADTRTATLDNGITDAAGNTYTLTAASGNQVPTDARPRIGSYLGGIKLPTDPNNLALEYTYDETMKVTSVKDAEAVLFGIRPAYQFRIAEGFRGERIDPLGNSYSVWYGKNDLSGAKSYGEFHDELGRVVRTEFDAWGRVTARQYPEGDRREFEYDDASNVTDLRKISKNGSITLSAFATYNLTWNKPASVTDFLGNTVDITYGSSGGAAGQIITAQRPLVYNPATAQTERPAYIFTYNAQGQLLTATDPEGVVARNDYYPLGHERAPGLLSSAAVDDLGFALTTSFSYDEQGNRSSVTDPRGFAPVWVPYDPGNPDGTIWDPECSCWFGPPIPPTPAHWSTSGYTSYFSYDAMGRQTRATDPQFNYTETIYDALGRTTRTKAYDAANNFLQATYWTYTATGQEDLVYNPYDPDPTNCADEEDPTTCTPYQGVTDNDYDDADRLITVTDAEGRKTRTIYNADGSVDRIIRAFGASIQQDYQTYTYMPSDAPVGAVPADYNGQQYTVTDANGNLTDYFFDGFDRLIKTQFPELATGLGISSPTDYEAFDYDDNGNLLIKRTRNKDIIFSSYDPLNRVESKIACDADWTGAVDKSLLVNCSAATGIIESEVQYLYDLTGRQTEAKYADGSFNIDHSYDTAGRLTRTVNAFFRTGGAAVSRDLDYGYDPAGNRTRLDYPGSHYEMYGYDALNRLTTISPTTGNPHRTYTYDALSRRLSATGRGLDTTYGYEADSALDTLNHSIATGAMTADYTFDYNLANQVTSKDVSDVSLIYGYGAEKNETYTANGLNQYPTINQDGLNLSLFYDGNGSLTDAGDWAYQYDVENRLTRADGPGVSAEYLYDPLGRRYRKCVVALEDIADPCLHASVLATDTVYDGVEAIRDYDGVSGGGLNFYVHGAGVDEMVATYDNGARGGVVGWYLVVADYAGSTIAIQKHSATTAPDPADIYTYSAYGEVNNTTGFPFRYTGRRLDAETGLYYYRARYYSPALGRFLQTDPIGYGDNMNMYAYVGNDPVNFVDPAGTGASPFGWIVKLVKGGLKKIKKIKDKKEAVRLRNKGKDIQVRNRQSSGQVERASTSDPNDVTKHSGHDLKDGSGKTGRPHHQTEGKPGHTFWSIATAISILEIMEQLDPTYIRPLACAELDCNGNGIDDSLETDENGDQNDANSAEDTGNSEQSKEVNITGAGWSIDGDIITGTRCTGSLDCGK